MSWLYRFFKHTDNDQVVTLTTSYFQITGAATITGNLTVTGDTTYTGDYDITGIMDADWLQIDNIATTTWLRCPNTASLTTINATTANITGINTLGWATVTNTATAVTARIWTGPIYLGAGTQAIIWGAVTVDPINTGVAGVGGATGYDKGSLFIGGTAGLYIKTDYASTSWASMDQTD